MKKVSLKLNIMCFFNHKMKEKDDLTRQELHLRLQSSNSKSVI